MVARKHDGLLLTAAPGDEKQSYPEAAAPGPGSTVTADNRPLDWNWLQFSHSNRNVLSAAMMRACACVCVSVSRGRLQIDGFHCKFNRSMDQSIDLFSTTNKCRHHQEETWTASVCLFWHRPLFWLVKGLIVSALGWSLESGSNCPPWRWFLDKNCYLVIIPKFPNRYSSSSYAVLRIRGRSASTRCRCWHAMSGSFNSKRFIISSPL